jgi:acylphosphatase
MIARRVIIRGTVQGVGFRAWTEREAKKRNLTGWVRNVEDGTVESLIQGPEAEVKSMIEAFHVGPRFSAVTHVEAEDATFEKHSYFTIKD